MMKPLACLVAIGALAGCATQPPVRPTSGPSDPAIVALNRSAAKVQADLQELATLWQANAPHPAYVKTPASGPLAQPIDFRWDGPVREAVEGIAKLIGYRVAILGEAPAAPITVSVHARGETAFHVLRDIGWQAGSSCGVTVEPDQKTIVITYGRP